jgi:hypothetical protein
MHVASPEPQPIGTTSSRWTARRTVVTALFSAFAIVAAVGVVRTVLLLDDLADRRNKALYEQADSSGVRESKADAFRRIKLELSGSERFALVYGDDVDPDQRGFYQLYAGSYLYPAVAVFDPAAADAVMVFGAPPPSILEAFDEIGVTNGVWLGRRSR